MPDRQLIRRLVRAAGTIEYRLFHTALLRRRIGEKVLTCVAFYDGENQVIDVALRAHPTPLALVQSVAHELLHHIGYSEQQITRALESEVCESRALRETIAMCLLTVFMSPRGKRRGSA